VYGSASLDKGEQVIPLAWLATVIFRDNTGIKRHILCPVMTMAGLGLGLFIASTEVFGEDQHTGDVVMLTALTIGGGTIGYFWGRHLDKREFTVLIKH
jgi:hypothetical protein